jgi:hypothetical protein
MEQAREGHEIWVFMTLVVGFSLSFLVALVPHFDGAFRLEALMLAAWMVPYVILSVIVWFLRRPARLRTILALVGIHLLTAFIERGLLGDPNGILLYLVPLLTAVAFLLILPQLQGRMGDGPLGLVFNRFARKV